MIEVEKRRLADKDSSNVGSCKPCLECSICLEAASEPVVTLCGHLYCWPCMFRWLNSRHHGSTRCPVCKAAVSEDHLVPLYGLGKPAMDMDAAAARRKQGGGVGQVPRRPPVPNVEHHRRLQEHDNSDGGDYYDDGMDMDYYRGWAPVFHSSAECLLGGIALAVLLPWATRPLHRYGGEWRMARQQRRAASRLQQIWVFLAMVALLCFLLL